MTIGTIATTRLSTAAVVHMVQPRFEAPETTKESTFTLPPASEAQKAVMVSMAFTALFVIGNRAGHFSSPVRKNLSQVYAMIASSERLRVSPENTSGWLGTPRNSATTD